MDYFYSILVLIISLENLIVAKICPKDETKSLTDPENIYQCDDNKECCVEYAIEACCDNSATTDAILIQVKFWSGLVGALILVLVVVCWCRSYSHVCKKKSGNRERCSCCRCFSCCRKEKTTASDSDHLLLPPTCLEPTIGLTSRPESPASQQDSPCSRADSPSDSSSQDDDSPSTLSLQTCGQSIASHEDDDLTCNVTIT